MVLGEGYRDPEATRRHVIVSNEAVGIRAGELEQRRSPRNAKYVARENEWRMMDMTSWQTGW